MTNNNSFFFKNFSLKDFIDAFETIKDRIFKKYNYNFSIEEKEIKIFFKLIKIYGLEIIFNLKYISKIKDLNYIISNSEINENEAGVKNFFLNQILLLFIFLYYYINKKQAFFNNYNNKLEQKIKNLYTSLYIIILKYFSSSKLNNNQIIDINDIIEIFRLNIILSLNDLLNKILIFNESITYLVEFIIENNDTIKEINSFYLLFEQIYKDLLKNKKNLNILKRNQNIENFSIFKILNITYSQVCDINLKQLIFKLLDLIYNNNYSIGLSHILLNNIKEYFYEIKKNYNRKKIIKSIKSINSQTIFIENLFINEELEKKDEYMPSTYFVFDGSKDCGINYNPNGDLIKKNFTLIFSFKIEEIKDDIIYPLITFVAEHDKKEIVFNLSILNKKLYIFCQGETKMNLIDAISNNISYLLIIEYFKSSLMSILSDKIKITLNSKKIEINSININYKSKSSLKIGFLPNELIMNNSLFKNESHFNGIIGPIIFFNNILDEKDFASNILKLKGKYDTILFLNHNNNIDDYFYYEEYKIYSNKEFLLAQEYFKKLSKKIDEECLFTICPLSILNSINKKTNFFKEDIYEKGNKDKELFPNFNILQLYSSKTSSTYAKKNNKSISFFVEYDGIYIYTLIIEYFYNLLRMLLNEPKEEKKDIANEINNALCPIIRSITRILVFFKVNLFSNYLDTLGFSLKKLLSLIVDIQPLNIELVDTFNISFTKLLDYSKKLDDDISGTIILNFVNKLFTLICSYDFYDMSIYKNCENIFRLFQLIIKDNYCIINAEVMNSLLSFSFVLNSISLDKHNNKPNDFTFKKNIEYRQMKKEYKNLIICFIRQCDSFNLYIQFINLVLKKNISIFEKYKLIKIYYENHNVQNIYDNYIKERKEIESNKSFFDIFKKDKVSDKQNNNTHEELLNIYKKGLSKLINISPLIDSKNEKPFELLKSIFILLIFEHHLLIHFKSYNENLNNNNNDNLSNSNFSIPIEKINFFSKNALENINNNKAKIKLSSNSLINLSSSNSKNEKSDEFENTDIKLDFSSEDNSQSFEKVELSKNNNNCVNINIQELYIFDIILNSNSYSFYLIKSIFSCLCDEWNKINKIKFIKNIDETYESFELTFGQFNLFKKVLFSQYIQLIEYLNDENVLEKSLKLIFSFMNQCINTHKNNQNQNNSKSTFLHLFESKSIMNNFFDFCINNEIITKPIFKEYINSSIKDINNNMLIYHPRPYLFSFIKKSLKNVNSQIIKIIKNIFDYINEILKNGNNFDTSLNNYLYFNINRFIKTLLNTFEKIPTESQNLLINDNFIIFISLHNLIHQLNKSEIIYDPNLYIFNPIYLNKTNKTNEKKEIKILQSQETKVLNNQIIYLNVFEVALHSFILIWTYDKKKESNTEKYVVEYISKLYEEMLYNGHFLSYYFDVLNPFYHFNNKKIKDISGYLNKLINNELNENDKIYININPSVREMRMISLLIFLIILKYQSLLINHEKIKNYNFDAEFNSRKALIKKLFNKFVSIAIGDIISLSLNLNKIKENKKFDIIFEKLESKSKIFKEYNKNYYKYLFDIISKSKTYNLDNIKEEIEKKFIKDDNEKNRKIINFLKSSNSIINENLNIGNSTINKKEKNRKNSFILYTEYEEDKNNLNSLNNNNLKSNKNLIKDLNNMSDSQKIKNKNKNKKKLFLLDFEYASNPILCTKRDLVLTKFGYFYYKEYFKDNKFIKMKKLFFYINSAENENNGFNNYQNLMRNKCPYTVKNFSNHVLYYPKIFYRPFTKFFENKYFSISHKYFHNKYINECEEKKFNLQYGHGLLNQPNFNLYKISNNEEILNIMDTSLNSTLSNGSGDKIEFQNTLNNEEFENNLKIYENFSKNKIAKSLHISNKNLIVPSSMNIREDNNLKKSIVRNKKNKKSQKQKLTFNSNSKIFNIFSSFDQLNNHNKHIILFECELISPKNSSHGKIFLNKNFIIYQTETNFDSKKYEYEEKYLISCSNSDLEQNEKQIIIPYSLISQILSRKFLFFNQAVELFLHNGKSYFFNLYEEKIHDIFITELKQIIEIKQIKNCEIIVDSIDYFNKNKYMNLWLEGKIPTLEYLLLINKFSNRSYNVLSQYLILPWILIDFNDIYKTENYRNMSYPMPAQTKEGLEAIIKQYNRLNSNDYKCYFPILYSSSMYINNYLLRIYPFTNNQIKCQGGKFEEPGRQLDSIQDFCCLFKEINQATMELIPEFYFVPEIFLNLNFCYFGKNKNNIINNIKLGEGFKSILELISFHQNNLNSDTFSSQINKWIDNIFGENQITDKKNVINSFPKECYEKYVTEEINEKLKELEIQINNINYLRRSSSITLNTEYLTKNNIFSNIDIRPMTKRQIMADIKNIIMKTYFYGQCPSQLFTKNHPCYNKKSNSKINNLSNIDNFQISLKNDFIKIHDKDFLYIKESSNGNLFYILFDNQINVYNKLLKYMNNLSINSFVKITPPFSFNYNSNIKNTLKIQYMYKYLIFEILECKYFFAAGYLDNSFRIYTKEKEKNIIYSIYTENNVTCIRNIDNSNIFFTGHQNGKIIKWTYSLTNKDNLKKESNQMSINVCKQNSIYGHLSYVKIIEINDKIGIIISAGEDGIIFIRKIYDFELLSYIKLNKNKREIIDINAHKQIIILSVFKNKSKTFFIYTYSLNGIKLGKISEQVKLPISIIPESDDIFVIGCFNMYLVKISMKEKISLISITNDLNPCYIESGKEDRYEDIDEEENDNDTFNEDYCKSTPISYFYDLKNHVLFCLFANGKLHRVNLIKNM